MKVNEKVFKEYKKGLTKLSEKHTMYSKTTESEVKTVAECERRCSEVIYRKSITTDEPDTHAEATLKIEGLTEEATAELRKHFLKLCEEVEAAVQKETSPTT